MTTIIFSASISLSTTVSFASDMEKLLPFLTAFTQDIQQVYVIEEKIPDIIKVVETAQTAKAVNPVTNSNWEGRGVTPHYLTDSEKAFDEAFCLALQHNQKKASTTYVAEEAGKKIDDLGCKAAI